MRDLTLNLSWKWLTLSASYERNKNAITQWSFLRDNDVALIKHINLADPYDNYSAYIAGLQVTQELPPLLRLMEDLNALLKIVKPDTKEMDARLSINFNPLSTRDQLKDAQVREAMSRADRNYVEAGILFPEDIIRNRFQGGYKVDTTVEELHTPDLTMEGAK